MCSREVGTSASTSVTTCIMELCHSPMHLSLPEWAEQEAQALAACTTSDSEESRDPRHQSVEMYLDVVAGVVIAHSDDGSSCTE